MDVTSECVIAIFGKRGSGKSYTLGVLAEGLAADQGSKIASTRRIRSALLMDTLNIFWSLEYPFEIDPNPERFAREMSDLRTWGITPPALGVTVWIPRGFREQHTPSHYKDFSIAPHELSADDLADLFELDLQRDLMGQLLAEVRDKSIDRFRDFSMTQLLQTLDEDEEISEFYAEGTRRGLRQRIRAASRLPLFSSPAGTSLGELLPAGSLSILELGTLPNSIRSVIASVLLRRIQLERARASDAEKQISLNTHLSPEERTRLQAFLEDAIPPSWVLVDEAQNILPSSRDLKSTDAVVRFVREGRNFGLSFVLTTQQPSAVDQRILAQADTVICHRLTVAADIARMRDNLKSAEPAEVKFGTQRYDLAAWLRSLDAGTAVVTNTEYDRVFSLQIRPRVTPHAGTGFRFGA